MTRKEILDMPAGRELDAVKDGTTSIQSTGKIDKRSRYLKPEYRDIRQISLGNIFDTCSTPKDFYEALKAGGNETFYSLKKTHLKDDICISFATGGWSENEELINKLRKTIFWSLYWERSERGGLFVFYVSKAWWEKEIA